MSFWRVIAIWLAAQPFLALAWWALIRWRDNHEFHRRRTLAGRLAAAASVTRYVTLASRRPVGPLPDVLRAAQLRAMLDKTAPRA